MNLPKIYALITPDGRLLDARTDPPVSEVTIGGRVYEYAPVDWMMSDSPGFTPPEEGRPVVVKVIMVGNGVDVPTPVRYFVYSDFRLKSDWSLPWGWKYLGP